MSNKQWLPMVFWMVAVVPANAQYAGAIKGQVLDQHGGVVAGAKHTLNGPELPGQKTSVSNEMGNYIFRGSVAWRI